jgi:hypothetical protein
MKKEYSRLGYVISPRIFDKWNNYFEGASFDTNKDPEFALFKPNSSNILLLCNIIEEQEKQIKNLELELENIKSTN